LNKVDLEDGTSFYDALTIALDSISRHKGLRTLIALTDGADTHSITTLRSVVEKSKKLDIPIFIIGLGKVDHATLSKIAVETNGEYLYTSKANSLPALYEKIARKLKAVYELRYQSENFSSQDTLRAISLAVADSTISIKSVEKSFVLTPKIRKELIERERNRSYTYYSMAGAGIMSLIFIGLYKRKKRKEVNT
jgi:Ca-activated chloride channel family protein